MEIMHEQPVVEDPGVPQSRLQAAGEWLVSPAGVVVLSFVVSLSLAFHFAWKGTLSLPFYDEWALVPVVADMEPVNMRMIYEHFWQQHNEHRIPVPKLLMVLVWKMTAGSTHALTLLNVAGGAGIALILLCLIWQMRKRVSYVDAIVPFVFLHWGHGATFLSPFQFALVLPMFLFCLSLLLLLQIRSQCTVGRLVLLCGSLFLLPLSGLALLPGTVLLSLGLIAAVFAGNQPRSKAIRWSVIATVAATNLVIAVYFIGFTVPKSHDVLLAHSIRDVIRGGILACSNIKGVPIIHGTRGDIDSLLIVLCIVASVASLLYAACRRREIWWETVILMIGILGFGAIIAQLAYGRSRGPIADRYFMLVAPLLPLLLAASALRHRYKLNGPRVLEALLALVTVLALPNNYRSGASMKQEHRGVENAIRTAVREGRSIDEFQQQFNARLFPPIPDYIRVYHKVIYDKRLFAYRDIPVTAESRSGQPAASKDKSLETSGAHITAGFR